MRALYQRIYDFVEKTEDSVITNSEDVLLRVSQLVQDCLEFIRDFCVPSFSKLFPRHLCCDMISYTPQQWTVCFRT